MINLISIVLSANSLTITIFAIDIVLVLVSMGFLISLYIKTERRSKRKLFDDNAKGIKKLDADTYIIPANKKDKKQQYASDMNHLSNQLSEISELEQNNSDEMTESNEKSSLSKNIVKEEKSFVVIEKNNNKKLKNNSPANKNNNLSTGKNYGNYKNFSNLMDSIKNETNELEVDKNEKLKKSSKEKKR